MKLYGNEIFLVQKAIYRKLSGFFGLRRQNVNDLAVALDAAVIFGMLTEREKMADPTQRLSLVPTDQLISLLREKMGRLGIGHFEGGVEENV